MTVVVQVMGGVACVEATAGEEVLIFEWDYLREDLPREVFERIRRLVDAGRPLDGRDVLVEHRAKEV